MSNFPTTHITIGLPLPSVPFHELTATTPTSANIRRMQIRVLISPELKQEWDVFLRNLSHYARIALIDDLLAALEVSRKNLEELINLMNASRDAGKLFEIDDLGYMERRRR